MRKKLRQQKAETLVETLVALLIATMSVMVLTAAITGSARVNRQNADAEKAYVQDLEKAESYDETTVLTIIVKLQSETEGWKIERQGILYGADGKFASYK